MRYLVFVLLLAAPSLALAGDPCAKGWNGPINANTNPTQQTSSSTAPGGHTTFGSDTAVKTAYPH